MFGLYAPIASTIHRQGSEQMNIDELKAFVETQKKNLKNLWPQS